MSKHAKVVNSCRICDDLLPAAFFHLGQQPLANSLLKSASDTEEMYELALCHCRKCHTVQLTQTIKPEILFRDYVWVTGTAAATRSYADTFFTNVSKRLSSEVKAKITEIASNDGTFLKPFLDAGHDVQGVDPARNIAQIAEDKGIPTLAEFFSLDVARELRSTQGYSDVVIARNVIPHVEDVNNVIAGVTHLLDDDGIGVIEFHDASKIQSELHYDSIYHEHIFYFTLATLSYLLNKHGLYMFDIEESPISGGSWVVFFCRNADTTQSKILRQHLQNEITQKVNQASSWTTFSSACEEHAKELKSITNHYVNKGLTIVGYGASARSSTLLNYCALTDSSISLIADQNLMKQGLLTPGTHIPIEKPENVITPDVDVVFLLAWNFKNEIVGILRDDMGFKGPIILPLPNVVEIIEG
jgi:hypothetical protein